MYIEAWFWIVLLVVDVILFLILLLSNKFDRELFGAMMVFLLMYAMYPFAKTSDHPSAMDIYQGKTTLEITYRNGIPVDSVVVFKK